MNEQNDDNTVDIEDVNLDDFSAEFFGTKKEEVKEEAVKEDVDENEEDQSLATEDDDEDEDVEEQEDESEEEEVEEVPQIKQKRNRTQERIEKLVAEARQAERERDALRMEIERIRAETKEVKQEEAPKAVEKLSEEAPRPDAQDKDGNPVYELGEFDPKFIRDLTKFTIEQENKAAKEAALRAEEEARIAAAQEEIRTKWETNLEKAEEETPEIRENIGHLTTVFKGIDPGYGEYLASTIMFSDYGPQIMNYFAQNIGEAKKIVALGPSAATLAIGRLEAKFVKDSTKEEEKRNIKQVSQAAPPPENLQPRGRGGKFTVAPDTDDLNAFEREFFKR